MKKPINIPVQIESAKRGGIIAGEGKWEHYMIVTLTVAWSKKLFQQLEKHKDENWWLSLDEQGANQMTDVYVVETIWNAVCAVFTNSHAAEKYVKKIKALRGDDYAWCSTWRLNDPLPVEDV